MVIINDTQKSFHKCLNSLVEHSNRLYSYCKIALKLNIDLILLLLQQVIKKSSPCLLLIFSKTPSLRSLSQ